MLVLMLVEGDGRRWSGLGGALLRLLEKNCVVVVVVVVVVGMNRRVPRMMSRVQRTWS